VGSFFVHWTILLPGARSGLERIRSGLVGGVFLAAAVVFVRLGDRRTPRALRCLFLSSAPSSAARKPFGHGFTPH
jgi:hypothetical protein